MAQIVSPSRTPFGMLGDSRLQHLTNTKNKQNALAASPSSILSKRKHSSDPFGSDVDTENLDPSALSPKKSKLSSGDSLKSSFSSFSKPSHFILKTDNTSSVLSQAPSISSRPLATPKRPATKSLFDTTPRTAPAGRSPRRKRAGLGGKRRTSAPFTRINPPSLGLGETQGSGLPFSIDAALSGSVPTYQAPVPAPQVSAWEESVDSLGSHASKSSWFFDIHEDTAEQELGNLMEFSAQNLDISDEETKADKRRREMEDRGKENIPPEISGVEVAAPVAVPTSRKDAMSDEPRTPLGELESKEFYADGCDESSVVIVPEEGEDATEEATKEAAEECVQRDGNDYASQVEDALTEQLEQVVERDASPTDARCTNQDTWQELLARVDEQQKAIAVDNMVEGSSSHADAVVDVVIPEQVALPPSDDDIWAVEATSREEAPLFEIWESESAKEEAEELDATAI